MPAMSEQIVCAEEGQSRITSKNWPRVLDAWNKKAEQSGVRVPLTPEELTAVIGSERRDECVRRVGFELPPGLCGPEVPDCGDDF